MVFDELFRLHLRNAYRLMGKPIPDELYETNISTSGTRPSSQTDPTTIIAPTIDGEETSYFEWLGAGVYEVPNTAGAMHQVDRAASAHHRDPIRLQPQPSLRARGRLPPCGGSLGGRGRGSGPVAWFVGAVPDHREQTGASDLRRAIRGANRGRTAAGVIGPARGPRPSAWRGGHICRRAVRRFRHRTGETPGVSADHGEGPRRSVRGEELAGVESSPVERSVQGRGKPEW